MYCFGKDFIKETEIPSLLEDFLKQKEQNNKKKIDSTQTEQKRLKL